MVIATSPVRPSITIAATLTARPNETDWTELTPFLAKTRQ
jgi:hypothetical protein